MPGETQGQLEFEPASDPRHELVHGELRALGKKTIVIHHDPAAREHATVQELKRILDRIVKIEVDIGKGNLCRELARFYRIPDPTFFHLRARGREVYRIELAAHLRLGRR